jgi:hypothetical protein
MKCRVQCSHMPVAYIIKIRWELECPFVLVSLPSSEEARGAVMLCRKVPAIRYTTQNTYALVQYEA